MFSLLLGRIFETLVTDELRVSLGRRSISEAAIASDLIDGASKTIRVFILMVKDSGFMRLENILLVFVTLHDRADAIDRVSTSIVA